MVNPASTSPLVTVLLAIVVSFLVTLGLEHRASSHATSLYEPPCTEPTHKHRLGAPAGGRWIGGVGGNTIDLRGTGIEFGTTPKKPADKP